MPKRKFSQSKAADGGRRRWAADGEHGAFLPRSATNAARLARASNSIDQHRERLTRLFRKRNDPTDQLYIFFPQEAKVGVKPIRECVLCVVICVGARTACILTENASWSATHFRFCEKMESDKVLSAIMVVQEGVTPFAKSVSIKRGRQRPSKFTCF